MKYDADNDCTTVATDERFALSWRHVRRTPRLWRVFVAQRFAAWRRALAAYWEEP